ADKCEPFEFESLVGGDRVGAGGRSADGVEESVMDRAAQERPGVWQRERAVQGDPSVVSHVIGLGRAKRRGGGRIRATEDQPEKVSRLIARNRADGVKTRLVQTGDRRPLICLEVKDLAIGQSAGSPGASDYVELAVDQRRFVSLSRRLHRRRLPPRVGGC